MRGSGFPRAVKRQRLPEGAELSGNQGGVHPNTQGTEFKEILRPVP